MSGISDETSARITSVWQSVLAGLAAGKLVRDVIAKHSITRAMLRAYLVESAAHQRDWDTARESSADAFMDEALMVARTPNKDSVGAADARTRIDTLKWAARIRNPRLYGEKSQLDVNVRTVDLTAIILAANARLAAAREPRLIEGEHERIVELPESLV